MPDIDPNALMPEMTIKVTLAEFETTHARAGEARGRVEKRGELDKLSIAELYQVLADLRAGQRLSDAEDGPDFEFTPSYSLAILAVLAELRRRGERV